MIASPEDRPKGRPFQDKTDAGGLQSGRRRRPGVTPGKIPRRGDRFGMDWEDWNLFLTLFSVEETQPFIEELGLPLRPRQSPELLRLARACLEAKMFPTTLTPAGHASSPDFVEAWRAWRGSGGVLTDGELRGIHARLGHDWDAYLPRACDLLRRRGGDATADALLTRGRRHCFPYDHRRYACPRLLRDFAA